MPISRENLVRYPADWALRSRFIRFMRAKNRCEWCGIKNGTALPPRCCAEPAFGDGYNYCLTCGKTEARVVLTVAHVHDKRPEAADLLNLAALCQRCHNRHDAADRARSRRERREPAGQGRLFDTKETPQ